MEDWYKNCFAYDKRFMGKNGCRILKEMFCKTKGKCSFYKSTEQYLKDLRKYEALAEDFDTYNALYG